jgi:hypothetical protein
MKEDKYGKGKQERGIKERKKDIISMDHALVVTGPLRKKILSAIMESLGTMETWRLEFVQA